jgi:hypothetical protein
MGVGRTPGCYRLLFWGIQVGEPDWIDGRQPIEAIAIYTGGCDWSVFVDENAGIVAEYLEGNLYLWGDDGNYFHAAVNLNESISGIIQNQNTGYGEFDFGVGGWCSYRPVLDCETKPEIWVISCENQAIIDCSTEEECSHDSCFKARCRVGLINSLHAQFLGTIVVEFTWNFGLLENQYGIAYVDEDGYAMLVTDCIGLNYEDSPTTVQFSITDIVWVGWAYAPQYNSCLGCEQEVQPPVNCCDETPSTGTMYSVYRSNYGGVWYNILAANEYYNADIGYESETECGCTEYQFVCQEDANLNTGWRSVESLIGQADPTGATAVPHIAWVPCSQYYHWAVQYRGCGCETAGQQSNWMQAQ